MKYNLFENIMQFENVSESNLLLYAAKNYHNPLGASSEDFYEDLKRFTYVKRLVNKYLQTKELPERLILNHLIVIFNMFGIEAGCKILELKLDDEHWPVIKPFLIFLRYIDNKQYAELHMNKHVVEALRKI